MEHIVEAQVIRLTSPKIEEADKDRARVNRIGNYRTRRRRC